MKSFALALLSVTLCAVPAFSQSTRSDMSVEVTSASTGYLAGQRASFTVTVRNLGPDAAENVTVNGFFDTPWIRSFQAPDWDCTFDTQYSCTRKSMPLGASQIVMVGNLPNESRGGAVTASVSTTSLDPSPINNTSQVRYTTSVAPTSADLSLTAQAQQTVPIGSKAIVGLTVTNHGPDAASDVLVKVDVFPRGTAEDLTSPPAGWSCQFPASHAICSLPQLAAGQSSTVTLGISAPGFASTIGGFATVSMGLGNDVNFSNSRTNFFVGVGEQGDFARILLPVALPDRGGVRGAFRSLWVTEVRAFAAVPPGGEFSVFPQQDEGCQICTCPSPPLTGYSLRTALLAQLFPVTRSNQQPGRLLYTERAIADRVELSVRLYDRSRGDVWGTEMPVVREREFRTSETHLLSVPIDPRFRQTLRIYDPDARGDGEVRVRFFITTSASPIFERRLPLEVPPGNSVREVAIGLPVQPGYSELNNFAELIQHAPIVNLRIEITPLTPGLRFWAFVALTNNETQQVMTLTPQ